ncbi:MAG: 5'-methylthioadenosine/adenosylhomocysteine nucleosidase [Lachnospiraceae bacterium]|nr:5'-methylthioadenosine/adenosylhomocysteine nucleosidase [Lachnospiraceae bacterium]
MVIGIIGAMESEVLGLKNELTGNVVENKVGIRTFVSGKLNGVDVVVCQSGVGKVNMAAMTQALIDNYKPDYLLNTGIAGSLDAKIDIGDVVLATEAVEHDMSVGPFGYPRGQVPGMDVLAFPCDEKLRKIAKESCEKVNPDIKVFEGRVLTGDVFVSDSDLKKDLKGTFDGMCTEMEGAALAHVAYINKIPCLILRVISDKADNSAEEDYPTFEAKAAKHSLNLTNEFIRRLGE